MDNEFWGVGLFRIRSKPTPVFSKVILLTVLRL